MYSQGDEEKYIWLACGHLGADPIGVPRFLDIGAFNAKQLSNTRALYERGWSGVMIEPSPMPMHGLLQEYGDDPRITLIQAVVGFERQLTKMRITQDALSTSDAKCEERWRKAGGFYGSMWVPTITLDDIFLQFGGGFDFVSIDAEGVSFEILKALFKTEVRPLAICFEHDDRQTESFAAFDAAGYRMVYENAANRIVVRK